MKSELPDTIRRNETFHFKKRIPAELIGIPPFRENQAFVQFSLKTKSPHDALRAMDNAYSKFEELIKHARSYLKPSSIAPHESTKLTETPLRTPTQDDLEFSVDRFRSEYLAKYSNIEDPRYHREFGSLGRTIIAGVLEEDWDRIARELLDDTVLFPDRTLECARRLLERYHWDIDVDGDLFEYFCDRLRYAELSAVREIVERSKSKTFVSKSEIRRAELERQTGEYTVSDAVDDYITALPDKAEMHEKLRAASLVWSELMHTPRISEIDQAHVVEFIDLLRELPKNAKQRFPEATLLQALQRNKALKSPFPTISPRTIKTNYVGPLATAVTMAVGRKRARQNPFNGVKVFGSSETTQTRRAFKIRELRSVFSQPVFQGSHSKKRRNQPGTNIYMDHYYWPALIALFSGMRANEIAELKLSDIQWTEITNTRRPYFKVPGTKTKNAIRDLPVHPTLVELGFLQYVETIRASGNQRLFPEWHKPTGKKRSEGRCIRNFNERILPAAIDGPDRPSFHCFRHTLLSELERNDFSPLLMAKMIGHSSKETVTGKHYLDPQLEDYYERFCSLIKYEGLELGTLLSATD